MGTPGDLEWLFEERQKRVLEYLTILGAAIAGMAHAPPWIAVPLAGVVLLPVSNAVATASQIWTSSGVSLPEVRRVVTLRARCRATRMRRCSDG